jgi:tRNA dimethylallyltransferase
LKLPEDEFDSPLIAIVGPTGVGKSEAGVYLAERLRGEIVSADSMQIYRHMDIGTAKLGLEERRGIPHHMIDIVDPDDPYTVADYQRDAVMVIEEIRRRNKRVILVGGTGLYVKAIREGLDFSKAEGNPELRSELAEEARKKGNAYLYQRLTEVDPVTASRLHPNDVRRVIRALEIYLSTGRPMSEAAGKRNNWRYAMIMVGLAMKNRASLYARLNRRVDRMIAQGLVNEVQWLLDHGYGPDLNAMQAIGYKEIALHLMGRLSLEEAVEEVKKSTRRYAKRQLSWYRKDTSIRWFFVDDVSVPDILEEIVSYVEGFANGKTNILGRI